MAFSPDLSPLIPLSLIKERGKQGVRFMKFPASITELRTSKRASSPINEFRKPFYSERLKPQKQASALR
jgi:hypothetical protein